MLKPRIKWNVSIKMWVCRGGDLSAVGVTPARAYKFWKRERDMHHP